MDKDFFRAKIGRTGIEAFRLGFSATYRPGKKTICRALDEGLNFFFFFPIDNQMIRVLRDVAGTKRKDLIIATGAGNYIFHYQSPRKALEKRLRTLKTDYIDVFLYMGALKEKHFPERILEEMNSLKEEGKVRCIGISTHNRKLAGKLAGEGALDVLMIRYNAAHRGADDDIFPYLGPHDPGIISFTATCWKYLTRRPKDWAKEERIPDAGMCYRFVLSHPQVHVCMTAPSNMKQFEANIDAVKKGRLSDEDMEFMRRFGDVVHRSHGRSIFGFR